MATDHLRVGTEMENREIKVSISRWLREASLLFLPSDGNSLLRRIIMNSGEVDLHHYKLMHTVTGVLIRYQCNCVKVISIIPLTSDSF